MSLETNIKICRRISDRHKFDVEIKGYISGNDLMFDLEDANFSNSLDLLLLDITMPGLNGVDVAREARGLGYTGVIIFITASEDYFRDAFDVGAFHYIVKGESMAHFEEVFLKAVDVLKEMDRKEILLSGWGELRRVAISSIEYFEVVSRNIIVYYEGKVFEFHGHLKKLEEQLASNGFQRIHRNYLVSLMHIKNMTFHEVVMSNGKTLPVGRTYYSELKEAVNKIKM